MLRRVEVEGCIASNQTERTEKATAIKHAADGVKEGIELKLYSVPVCTPFVRFRSCSEVVNFLGMFLISCTDDVQHNPFPVLDSFGVDL